MSELAERLKAAEAKKKELEAKRDQREAERAEADAVIALERECKELEALDAAEAELGLLGRDFATVNTPGGLVIVKRAHPATFRKFSDTEKKNSQTIDLFIDKSIVYPDKGSFASLVELYPAVPLMCADAICYLAGARAEASAKK